MATAGAEYSLQEQLHPVPLSQGRQLSCRGQPSHAGSGSLRHTSLESWSCLTSGLESECKEGLCAAWRCSTCAQKVTQTSTPHAVKASSVNALEYVPCVSDSIDAFVFMQLP